MAFKTSFHTFQQIMELPLTDIQTQIFSAESDMRVYDHEHSKLWERAFRVGKARWDLEWIGALMEWEYDKKIVPSTCHWLTIYFKSITRSSDTPYEACLLIDLLFNFLPIGWLLRDRHSHDTNDRMAAAVLVKLGFSYIDPTQKERAQELLAKFTREFLNQLAPLIIQVVKEAGNCSEAWQIKRVFLGRPQRSGNTVTLNLSYEAKHSSEKEFNAASNVLLWTGDWNPVGTDEMRSG